MMGQDAELLAEQAYLTLPARGRVYRRPVYRRIGKTKNMSKIRDEIIWKRFAILPNSEGQKYTLGDRFKSREEHGELIFWDRNNGEDPQGNFMCEITVEKNKFWVKPLMGHPIFVNDSKIETRTKLEFGDRLSLEEKPKDYRKIWTVKPSPTNFIFQKREFELTKSQETNKKESDTFPDLTKRGIRRSLKEKDVALAVGHNGVILQEIMAYLPVSILKGIRLVCKLWNEEASKYLKKRGHVALNFCGEYEIRPFHNLTYTMKLLKYSYDMRNDPIPNLCVTLPTFVHKQLYRPSSSYLEYCEGSPGEKLLSDLDFFVSKGHAIKRLSLQGTIESQLDLDVRIKILGHLQLNLEDLDFKFSVYENWQQKLAFPSSLVFKKLKRFTTLIEAFNETTLNPILDSGFLQPLINSVKGVKSLHLNSCSRSVVYFLQNINTFSNLEEISLWETKPEDLELLQSCKNLLKKIHINFIACLANTAQGISVFQNFEALLRYHSPILEDFLFKIHILFHPLRIHLPVLPKLKKLNITLSGDCEETMFHFSGSGEQGIDYAKQFPLLQSLTLAPRGWTDSTINPFFPKQDCEDEEEPQICKTLQILDICYSNYFSHCPRTLELAVIFPNVHNEWMNGARVQKTNIPAIGTESNQEVKDARVGVKKTPDPHAMSLRPRRQPHASNEVARSSRGKVVSRK